MTLAKLLKQTKIKDVNTLAGALGFHRSRLYFMYKNEPERLEQMIADEYLRKVSEAFENKDG